MCPLLCRPASLLSRLVAVPTIACSIAACWQDLGVDVAPRLQTLSVEEPAKRKVGWWLRHLSWKGARSTPGCACPPRAPPGAADRYDGPTLWPLPPFPLRPAGSAACGAGLQAPRRPPRLCSLRCLTSRCVSLPQGGVMVSSAAELVDKLRNEAKII